MNFNCQRTIIVASVTTSAAIIDKLIIYTPETMHKSSPSKTKTCILSGPCFHLQVNVAKWLGLLISDKYMLHSPLLTAYMLTPSLSLCTTTIQYYLLPICVESTQPSINQIVYF